MSKRAASWLAWSMCALSLALIALSFLLIVLILNLNTPTYFYWLEPTAIAVGYSVIGAILVPRLPHHPIGWICCAIGFLGAVEHFSGEYAVYALLAQPGPPLAGGQAALWLSLALDSNDRPYRVLAPSVPHWKATEQTLEVVCLAQRSCNSNSSDIGSYLTRCRPLYPWAF